MVIAVLEMLLPRGNEAVTIRALRAFWDTTCARLGRVGGGVFQEVGHPQTALYIEMCKRPRRSSSTFAHQGTSSCSHSWTRRPPARRCGSTSSPRHAGSRGWSRSDSEPRAPPEATVSSGR